MQIQWTSVSERMPEEGKKVYIQGEDFVTQAYYHVGMYWQDANRGEQRFSLAAVTQWAEVDHVQDVVDYVADKAMEHERHGLQYTPTETLEQMAVDYSNGRWMTEGEVEAAYRGYLAGYCQALEINSPEKLDSSNNNIGKTMETMDDKNRIEAVIEMLEEHLNDICAIGLSEEGTDSLLHRPSYALNMLRFFNEQQKTQKS